jgi:hypothetical protein
MVDFFIESYSSVIYVIRQPHCGLTVSIQSPCQIVFSVGKQAVITEIFTNYDRICERSKRLFLHQAGGGRAPTSFVALCLMVMPAAEMAQCWSATNQAFIVAAIDMFRCKGLSHGHHYPRGSAEQTHRPVQASSWVGKRRQ